MNQTIWKYSLEEKDFNTLLMPKGAEVLSAQMQGGLICLWVLVDPDGIKEERSFEIFGTGHPIACDMGVERRFIDTIQIPHLFLVFHVFERIN